MKKIITKRIILSVVLITLAVVVAAASTPAFAARRGGSSSSNKSSSNKSSSNKKPSDSKKSSNKKSSNSNKRCSTTCPAFTATKGGITYSITAGASYQCSRGWPAGGCGTVNGEAVSMVGPNSLSASWGEGCGNVHFYSASIIRRTTIPVVTPPTASSTTGNTNTTTTNTNNTIDLECTPGVDCPEVDLGNIINEARLGSSYASAVNSKCPFFWMTGNEDQKRKIECQITTNGVTTVVPKNQPDHLNGWLVPVGQSTFTCSRGGEATTTESKVFTCNANPNVIER